jgi:hypothetical protein
MKQCWENICGVRHKVHTMGIPYEGPMYIVGDNQLVLVYTEIPESTPCKKFQSIVYHFVWEGSIRDTWRTRYVNTNDNESDILLVKSVRDLYKVYFITSTGLNYMDRRGGCSILPNVNHHTDIDLWGTYYLMWYEPSDILSMDVFCQCAILLVKMFFEC